MTVRTPPSATYRLQFNREFTFADAARIVPHLAMLGVSHVYASPFLKARSGSPHGYDIVDHNALNPELGDEASFAAYVATLHRHHMGQILDIVPNHMGVGGHDNDWWLDVLENGEASDYAGHFDIDWHPVNRALRNKVLLPFLGDHYGTVLEQGGLRLALDPEAGSFAVHYHEHRFPIDPRTYPQILSLHGDELAQQLGDQPGVLATFRSLIADCKALPRRTDLSAAHRARRRQGVAACKRRLAALCREHPGIVRFLQGNIARLNGTPGQSKSYDGLHRLLESQAYRLAYWLVASDEINYRRFFDINDLAGIRMENAEVFRATHRLIRRMIGKGQLDGLRIDHLDGLSDPDKYCRDLRQLVQAAAAEAGREEASCYLVVEKILAGHERLPSHWPVAGTTGYDAGRLLNGMFIHPDGEKQLTQQYSRFTGTHASFDEVLYACKKLIMDSALASELSVLANLLSRIAQADRHTRDFTYQSLRNALCEVVACFPVYRTYITRERISDEDRRQVDWAIARAKAHDHTRDLNIFDFIHELLLLRRLERYPPVLQRRIIHFTSRFQQYSAPVMAKGMEDTALYVYNRLVSLNDVGFDPRAFGIPVEDFHAANRQRQAGWPQAMVSTSTHDSKRGEDVRARISVLSEVAEDWRRHLRRWSRINRSRKQPLDGGLAPSRNDEYLLYQTLLGAWPVMPVDAAGLEALRQRIEDYMIKAIREAKMRTSWAYPNPAYEGAMRRFVHALLDRPDNNLFLSDFLPFQQRLARFGLLNSLSQTLLKLTVPGVPDIYQGNELWAFNLVDPDNRRPVDYDQRHSALRTLTERIEAGDNLSALTRKLLQQMADGRVKLYLTWRTLFIRHRYPQLFMDGDYTGLATEGPRSDHLCAFARCWQGTTIIVVATRWFARLPAAGEELPLGEEIWADTYIKPPDNAQATAYRNALTDERIACVERDDGLYFRAADLLRSFTVALLLAEETDNAGYSR